MAESAAGVVGTVAEFTLKGLAQKAGLKFLDTLYKAPLKFFLAKGLSDLFGSANQEEFEQVFAQLKQIDQDLKLFKTEILQEINETELETQHVRIDTTYKNLLSVIDKGTTKEEIDRLTQEAFDSFFADDIVEILDNIGSETEIINDSITGSGAHVEKYFDIVTDHLYQTNSNIDHFYNRLYQLSEFYNKDYLHAILVLGAIQRCAPNSHRRDRAGEHISDILGYSDELSDKIAKLMRTMADTHDALLSAHPLSVVNRATGKTLGRYFQLNDHRYEDYAKFEMKDKGDGYFYLKVAGKNAGIDHYYGKDIRPVNKADSGHPNHLWRFVPSEQNPKRWFRIQNKATGQILDHYYGRDIRTSGLDGHPNHLWEVLPAMDGNHCFIVNGHTGEALCYHDNKIKTFHGKLTIDAGIHNPALPLPGGWSSSNWLFSYTEDSSYCNLVVQSSGDAVDYYDGESFRFVPAPSGHPNHLWGLEPTSIDEDVVYYFLRNKATNQVLDHCYGKSMAGANDGNAQGPHPNHIWKLESGF